MRLTSVLDLMGLMLLVAAGAVAAWVFVESWAGLAAGGVGTLGVSWLIDRRAAPLVDRRASS